MTDDTVTMSLAEAGQLVERAALGAGASPETAASLARATLAAEAEGQASVGLSHFVDYLQALEAGRIDGRAEPEISRPVPAIFLSDARGGAAHPGFDRVFEDMVAAAGAIGLSAFSQRNSFTCGALGYFTGRLAERGLVALAATNGPALVAGSGGTEAVYCTNPMSFAAPQADGPPLIIDQSSSATAFVNVRQAAAEGRPIPAGWALDASGKPTTDAAEAVKGTLLAFGGARGANIALMVEVLAAGLSGANWSLDAPPFASGSKGPGRACSCWRSTLACSTAGSRSACAPAAAAFGALPRPYPRPCQVRGQGPIGRGRGGGAARRARRDRQARRRAVLDGNKGCRGKSPAMPGGAFQN